MKKKPLEDTTHETTDGDARRSRLREIQRELVEVDTQAGPREKPAELNELLTDLLSKKKRRKHQLKAIKEFFDDPSQFGVDADDIPHSSSREEILERHKELSYRAGLLRSVLGVLRKEAAK